MWYLKKKKNTQKKLLGYEGRQVRAALPSGCEKWLQTDEVIRSLFTWSDFDGSEGRLKRAVRPARVRQKYCRWHSNDDDTGVCGKPVWTSTRRDEGASVVVATAQTESKTLLRPESIKIETRPRLKKNHSETEQTVSLFTCSWCLHGTTSYLLKIF